MVKPQFTHGLVVLAFALTPGVSNAQVSNYVRVIDAAGVPPLTGPNCISARAGARHHTYAIVAQNPSAEVYAFDGAVFHSAKSGCAPTTEYPSVRGGTVTGKTVYGPGESGSLYAIFDSDTYQCGRAQIDFGFKRPSDYGIMAGNFSGLFFGLVYDYGIDCAPVIKTTCEPAAFAISALTVVGRSVTATVRLAEGYDNIQVYLTSYASETMWPTHAGQLVLTYPQTAFSQQTGVITAGTTVTASVGIAEQPWDAWHVVLSCGPSSAQMSSAANLPATVLRQVFDNNRDFVP